LTFLKISDTVRAENDEEKMKKYTAAFIKETKSKKILSEVLKRGNDDWVSWNAVSNPNCPASTLEMVLKRGKNDNVSYYAVKNPNCPALAKINWMRATGKIGQFDPSKHIMESDEKEYKEDPDLQKLRDLIKEK